MRMRIKLKTSIVLIIYMLSFCLAIGQLRYVLTLQNVWRLVYIGSVYLIIILGVLYIFLQIRKSGILKYTFLFCIFILYELFVSYANNMIYLSQMIIDILPWPILLCVFYEYCSRNELPSLFHKITLIGTSACAILSISNVREHLVDWGRHGAIIFPVYFLIGELALIMLKRNRKTNYFYMIVTSALLIVSTKRGGVLASLGGMILYFLVDAHINNSLKEKIKKYGIYVVVFIIAAVLGVYLINRYNISIFERFMALSDDEGSGRIHIWTVVLNRFNESSIIKKLFGHGFHAVYYKVHPLSNAYNSFAHNSYLETLYDYGIVGVAFLIFLLWKIIRLGFYMMKTKYSDVTIWAYTMIPMLFLSLVSYFFEQTIIIVPFAIVWGILLGNYRREIILRRGR